MWGEETITWSGSLDAGLGERALRRVADQRHVRLEAEALLPHAARGLAGDAPAVEELGRRRRLGDDRRERVVAVAEQERGGGVAGVALVGGAGAAAAQVRQHGQPAIRRGEPQRGDGAARRAGEVDREALVAEVERGVDRVGVGLVEVGGGRRREVDRARAGAVGQRSARGLDAHRRRVLVERGDHARALAAARPERASELLVLEPVARDVGPVGDDRMSVTVIAHTVCPDGAYQQSEVRP